MITIDAAEVAEQCQFRRRKRTPLVGEAARRNLQAGLFERGVSQRRPPRSWSRAPARLDKAGPCVLVGHSYGGMIINEVGTNAGGHQKRRTGWRRLPGRRPQCVCGRFRGRCAKPVARFTAISQVPVAREAFRAKAVVAAWKQKPNYAVISK
jgi:hypothetical protein